MELLCRLLLLTTMHRAERIELKFLPRITTLREITTMLKKFGRQFLVKKKTVIMIMIEDPFLHG